MRSRRSSFARERRFTPKPELLAEFEDCLKEGGRKRHDGETGLAEKKEFGEFLVGFELIKRDRLRKRAYG